MPLKVSHTYWDRAFSIYRIKIPQMWVASKRLKLQNICISTSFSRKIVFRQESEVEFSHALWLFVGLKQNEFYSLLLERANILVYSLFVQFSKAQKKTPIIIIEGLHRALACMPEFEINTWKHCGGSYGGISHIYHLFVTTIWIEGCHPYQFKATV